MPDFVREALEGRGLMALYQTLVLGAPVEKTHFMPIDIVTKENQAFYQN